MNKAKFDQDDSRWQWLYRLGGAAALLIVAFIPLQVIIFMTWPPPTTALGYFTLFQSNPLVALLDLDLLLVIDQIVGHRHPAGVLHRSAANQRSRDDRRAGAGPGRDGLVFRLEHGVQHAHAQQSVRRRHHRGAACHVSGRR